MASVRELSWALLAATFLSLVSGVVRVRADALITGVVFCDQCKDGERSLFDYPLFGAKVAVACGGADGAVSLYKEDTTNWFGSYAVRFEGNPDLSACSARVVGGMQECGERAGPPQGIKLMFRMFGMALYTVDPLLSQPHQPMPFCPNHDAPSPPAAVMRPPPPPPLLPLLPPMVPVPRPPSLPFLEASACPYDKWMMPEFKCYWRMVAPDTKVAVAFGLVAAGKYGTDMTLWDGLQGRGDLYRTLLREGTTALLNSYHSMQFFYPTLSVISNMNWALLSSPRDALMMALRFRRANHGASSQGYVSCNFSPCP